MFFCYENSPSFLEPLLDIAFSVPLPLSSALSIKGKCNTKVFM